MTERKKRLMHPQKVTVIKPSGERYEDVDASVHSNKIFFNDPMLPLEVGDVVQRALPSGLTEEFEITAPNFHPKGRHFPAHFQATYRPVKRLTDDGDKTVTYNISGTNARVNVHSLDNSANMTDETHSDLT